MKDLWQKEKLWIHSKQVFKLRDSRASASANPGSASVYDNVKVHDDDDDGDDDGDDDDNNSGYDVRDDPRRSWLFSAFSDSHLFMI